jgi:hypothetical protein
MVINKISQTRRDRIKRNVRTRHYIKYGMVKEWTRGQLEST